MKSHEIDHLTADLNEHYVSFIVAGQLFGIPVTQVREILGVQTIARVPLAPKQVAGSLNLRGRIVTAINLHSLLNLSYYLDTLPPINMVVEYKDELYSLMIESVLDVAQISHDKIEKTPQTLDDIWKNIACGVVYLEEKIMVIMDTNALLKHDIK